MLISVTSLLYTELKKAASNRSSFWDIWEIRGLILLSLLLQVALVGLGHRLARRSSTKNAIVWLAYLSADWLATASLSNLMRSEKEEFTELAALWAPFLLLHLGGPDSITAYSLEDNQLWARHLINLCYQVLVAVYVFYKFHGNSITTYLAIPMFVAGTIKYGERTWCLWSASDYKLKDKVVSSSTKRELRFLSFVDPAKSLHDQVTRWCGQDIEARCLYVCYTLIKFFKPLFVDLNMKLPGDFVQKGGFHESCSLTMKLVDTELGFLYDEIYTKIPLLYTFTGVALRGISILCSFSVLIVFSFVVFDTTTTQIPTQYSTRDIYISFVLLVGAVVLEVYSITTFCLSNWALLWGTKSQNILSTLICKANALVRKASATTKIDIPQYNLMNYCLKFPSRYNLLEPDNFLMKWWCTTWEKIDWEKSIQIHLDKRIKTYFQTGVVYTFNKKNYEGFSFLKLIEKRLSCPESSIVLLKSMGLGQHIIVWHLTTDICYHQERYNSNDYETSKLLSDYMMFILMSQSSMLIDKGNHELLCKNICSYMSKNYDGPNDVRELTRFLRDTPENDSNIRCPVELAQQLQKLGDEERWGLIREAWVEILAHVAFHCPGKEHLKCLDRGGDLVTKVSLAMAHHGVSSRIHLYPLTDILNSDGLYARMFMNTPN